MKKICWLFIIMVFMGCNTKQPDKTSSATDTAKTIKTDTANIITDTHSFWNADWDQKKGLVMKKVFPLYEDSLTAPILIQKLNSLYPGIQLRYRKISGDTIFVAIDKSSYLTKQVGSTGAKGYLAEVTFNLTELKNINFVDMHFKEGDHAAPGTYTRTDFVR
jgi:hypothetical protein